MMEYGTLIEAIRARLEAEMGVQVLIGPLPPSGGLCLSVASGANKRDMAGNAQVTMRVNINAKDDDQLESLNRLAAAHTLVQNYAGESETFQLTGVSVITTPAIMQDQVGNYLTVSTLEVRAVFWGDWT